MQQAKRSGKESYEDAETILGDVYLLARVPQHRQLLAAGIPLGDHFSSSNRELVTG